MATEPSQVNITEESSLGQHLHAALGQHDCITVNIDPGPAMAEVRAGWIRDHSYAEPTWSYVLNESPQYLTLL